MTSIIFASAIFFNCVSSFFLKKFAISSKETADFLMVFLALSSYGVAFVLYSILLSRLPMPIVYSFITSGTAIGLVIIDRCYFGYSFNSIHLLGIMFLLIGGTMLMTKGA